MAFSQDLETRQKKNQCYADIESGLWGWQCKSSATAKENCALRCLSPTCYEIIYESDPELRLLNEKYALERKFSDLRLAIDEKQNEAVSSALNELVRRKGDLEENLKLTHELKAAEDERYVFMSSMLGLLAEYRIWPRVINASSISSSLKVIG
ncbi:hypothetical protein L484_023840 [Morus notabilis]|uniref:RING-type E3 ubiquitin transferase n=1 Tax=Morus notabilis TaxID=981085 RepID=W9RTQ4_9ROSA|nr:hypothetical protein L484_023840 [Morus notabilis]